MSTKVNRIALNGKHKSRALSIVQKYFPNVQSVEEADKPIHVEVTKQDSNSAAVRNHEGCAMAVACKRKMKADGVIVSIGTAYIVKGNKAYRYRVPPSIQREIVSFDRNAGFAEGEYELATTLPSMKLGEERPPKGPEKRTGKPLKFRHETSGIRTVLGSDMERV
jgi:hypothetical protein